MPAEHIAVVMGCALAVLCCLAFIPYLSYCDDGGAVYSSSCKKHAEKPTLQAGEEYRECLEPCTAGPGESIDPKRCVWQPKYKATDSGVRREETIICVVGHTVKQPGSVL
jgi:hypothetical protein